MSTQSVLEARNNLSRLIAESQAGEDVVITKRGTPVARIVPIGPVDMVRSGRVLVEWIGRDPLPDRLIRTTAEIDRQIRENRDDWE
ncbi:type II toxin-antitoxin system Phd/YefM family antitoxin [Microbacterium paraoxydans]|uniref:Antitoxin n=1 Tax=Microbacterium paraoxydans TaxID=199592 RepID=A0ABS5IPJ1_9MICO|nr:type II toxin-antitoxin system prevent-host-death family antitoxin [Microbacterium paraoxydans]MBS0024177.1 type II toxin-antitoxin system prevent-host-death family antitoxin [Microbacterium paraoxydans]